MPINASWETNPHVAQHIKNKEMLRLPSLLSKINTRTIQLSPQSEIEFRKLLISSQSSLEGELTLREELSAQLFDTIWDGNYKRFVEIVQRAEDGGFNVVHHLVRYNKGTLLDYREKLHESWDLLVNEGQMFLPFTIGLTSKKFKKITKRITYFLASEANKILKDHGYVLFSYPDVPEYLKGFHQHIERRDYLLFSYPDVPSWDKYELILPKDLELIFRRFTKDGAIPIVRSPYTFPAHFSLYVKKVKGPKPNTILREFYWLKNVDIYNSNVCERVPRCKICMAADVLNKEPLFMEKELLRRLMDQIVGIHSVHFPGTGDPFDDSNIFDHLDYASKKVGMGVRVNTNLSKFPTEMDEAEKFIRRLPRNIHIFVSEDKYHYDCDPHLYEKIKLLGKLSKKFGFNITSSARSLKYKHPIHYPMHQEFRYGIVWNRVLKMGNAKKMKDARPMSLEKLRDNIANEPGVGVLTDGTVITNFIIAYLPEDSRPSYGVLGNIKEDSMYDLMKRYEKLMHYLSNRPNVALKSMDTEMRGRYPYVLKHSVD